MNYHKSAFLYGMRIEDNVDFKAEVDAYKSGYEKAIVDVLKLAQGEVINDVIKNMIDVEKVKELLTKLE